MVRKYVAAVDIGTTIIRCLIVDRAGKIVGHARRQTKLLTPAPGCVEIDPDDLWNWFTAVVKEALEDAKCSASELVSMGISTHRNTFITWDKETGKPFHNFITWQDTRTQDYCEDWNQSMTIRCMNAGSRCLYAFTRNSRYLAGSVFQLKTVMVVVRLMWMIDQIPLLKQRIADKQVYYGCIETWLVWRLTKSKIFVTEYSLACCTGMFDPFIMSWSGMILKMLNCPAHILPEVKDTSGIFGYIDASIFGAEIPIAALAGDQQASMFGCCCFDIGSVMLCVGTGTFLDLNTGRKPHTSITDLFGIIPVVGWKIKDELVFLSEACSHDTGTAVNWAQSIGLFEDVSKTEHMANSVSDSNGTYFVPAFNGLQSPINDERACTGFIGMKSTTNRCHMTRAVLESIAFRAHQVFEVMQKEAEYDLGSVVITGGVSNNSFVCQLVSDITSREVVRLEITDTAALGVAFLAGLAVGFWKDRAELKDLLEVSHVFKPCGKSDRTKLLETYKEWQRAVTRCLDWYSN